MGGNDTVREEQVALTLFLVFYVGRSKGTTVLNVAIKCQEGSYRTVVGTYYYSLATYNVQTS